MSRWRLPGAYYPRWRQVRIHAILDHYRANFFRGKTMMEVGCGDGSIGNFFYYLGCQVTCCDARQEFLDEVAYRNHEIRTAQCNLEEAWPLPDECFDVILNLGVLYHLAEPHDCIVENARHCNHLVLDCEVTPSGGVRTCSMPENPPERLADEGDDHAFSGMGSRPTPAYIEAAIRDGGMEPVMLNTTAYDDHPYPHKLGWGETGAYRNGMRRLWFAKKTG